MRRAAVVAALAFALLAVVHGAVHFSDEFATTDAWHLHSSHSKYNGEWEHSAGETYLVDKDDKGLMVGSVARHHGASTQFKTPFVAKDHKALVVQYEVQLTKGLECGGAYVKLLDAAAGWSPAEFTDATPYIIMFGPDKCGTTNKVHFIFRHQNPLNGSWEEKHLKNPPAIRTDKLSHLYTLVVNHDQSFEVFIDQESVRKGSLLEDFDPPVNPPATIPDPTDSKPEDWVDEAEIPDATATKPDDWDEEAPQYIEDEEAERPAGWLEGSPSSCRTPRPPSPTTGPTTRTAPGPPRPRPAPLGPGRAGLTAGAQEAPMVPNPKCAEVGCGEWKRPTKRNPRYKGKWRAPMVPNPAYKGPWAPRQIPNPDHYEDAAPSHFPAMDGLGLELWTMTAGVKFDNFLLADDPADAREHARKVFTAKAKRQEKLKEKEDDAELEKERERRQKDKPDPAANTWQAKLQRWVRAARRAAEERPLAVAGTLLVGGLALLAFAFTGSSKKPAPAATAAAGAAEGEAAGAGAGAAGAEGEAKEGDKSATEGEATGAEEEERAARAEEPAPAKGPRTRRGAKRAE
eukprot:tig00001527_g9262.t1